MDMHSIFLNIEILREIKSNWIIDMQLRAYLRTLTNNSTQYK